MCMDGDETKRSYEGGDRMRNHRESRVYCDPSPVSFHHITVSLPGSGLGPGSVVLGGLCSGGSSVWKGEAEVRWVWSVTRIIGRSAPQIVKLEFYGANKPPAAEQSETRVTSPYNGR